MMKVNTTKDAEQAFVKLLNKYMPEAIKMASSNFQVASILEVNEDARTVNVKINKTGQILRNIKYYRGADSVAIGSTCLIFKVDNSNTNFIIGIY